MKRNRIPKANAKIKKAPTGYACDWCYGKAKGWIGCPEEALFIMEAPIIENFRKVGMSLTFICAGCTVEDIDEW